MKIKVNGYEVELNPEELRHFKLDEAKDIKKFIEDLKDKDKKIGFYVEENKKNCVFVFNAKQADEKRKKRN